MGRPVLGLLPIPFRWVLRTTFLVIHRHNSAYLNLHTSALEKEFNLEDGGCMFLRNLVSAYKSHNCEYLALLAI
jgi:hypothetical protein